jgi:hypothetical protein
MTGSKNEPGLSLTKAGRFYDLSYRAPRFLSLLKLLTKRLPIGRYVCY